MYNFTQKKVTKASISHRKPICGIGINDADYVVQPTVNGKPLICPVYMKWNSMLQRCYSEKCQEKHPTYIGCSVSEEWLLFSNFSTWMLTQDYVGMELDKDIKIKGNKLYSPNTCLFIPRALNSLLNDSAAKRGLYQVGVCFNKRRNKFIAQINYSCKLKHLGYFSSEIAASQVYQTARTAKIQQLINDNVYPMATQYLGRHL